MIILVIEELDNQNIKADFLEKSTINLVRLCHIHIRIKRAADGYRNFYTINGRFEKKISL